MQGIIAIGALVASLLGGSFQATNISGGWTFRTNAHVTVGEHLVCAGHPTNVTSVSGSTFGVSPRVPVAGGAVVTCVEN
jgi:hypothetical protein